MHSIMAPRTRKGNSMARMQKYLVRLNLTASAPTPTYDYRFGEGRTPVEAVQQAYGILTPRMAAKPVTLQTLRIDKRRRAAMADPQGWITWHEQYNADRKRFVFIQIDPTQGA